MQLLEVYPEITSFMKKVIDEQYLEQSDWIALQFDTFKGYMLNRCTSKAAAQKYLDERMQRCEVRSYRDSILSNMTFFFKTKVVGQNAEAPETAYDTFQ